MVRTLQNNPAFSEVLLKNMPPSELLVSQQIKYVWEMLSQLVIFSLSCMLISSHFMILTCVSLAGDILCYFGLWCPNWKADFGLTLNCLSSQWLIWRMDLYSCVTLTPLQQVRMLKFGLSVLSNWRGIGERTLKIAKEWNHKGYGRKFYLPQRVERSFSRSNKTRIPVKAVWMASG